MLYKCTSTGQRLFVAVARPALDLLAAFSYLVQGRGDNFRAVFRAYRDFFRWHKDLSRKRRAIRENRKGSATEHIYRGSVVLRYILGRRRSAQNDALNLKSAKTEKSVRSAGGTFVPR